MSGLANRRRAEALTEFILARVWNPDTCLPIMLFMDPGQGEAISEPAPSTDWSEISAACQERAVLLEKNDPDIIMGHRYEIDRMVLDNRYPVEHKTSCNLHPGYSTDPNVWARGCDCGATARAAQQRKNG